ncbi:MAG: 3-hydroxyacyl-CoA dehydrogenase/enoyl-CoA hydratase family protein [Acidobacteria bacterium]|nr:MAG: 3-hydroxyacyl-CoA dehydrogenase/enoyl-CoA hydratase family protein [Acidobacteriota bacterium]
MAQLLQRVVVLGAGTMGSRLAAHCANHGLNVHLLDQTTELAASGLQAAAKSRPAAFFLPRLAEAIRTGDFASGNKAIAEADWVVEAIVENLDAKRALLARVAPQLRADALLTTNTSGLPVAAVGAQLPDKVKRRWLGTHFFNPPRYMRLVEMIPTPTTDAEAVAWLRRAIELRLGKGVVIARDTPNFIANRIGVFALMNTLRLMQEFELGIEDIDALTGLLLGWPKSATFRTLDMIGLDTLAQVVQNSYANLPKDEHRELFVVPEFVKAMLQRGWLGEKSGQGFYRKQGDQIDALDLKTMTYHPRRKVRLPFDTLAAAVKQSEFVRRGLEELFAYCQARLGEISDDPEAIDQAMEWGYNWQHGPFAMESVVETGKGPARPLGVSVRANPGCSLLDLGDGVGCLEFHSKMNVLGADTVAMMQTTLADSGLPFDAFVITNGGEQFSVGADLAYLLALIQNEEWDEVEEAVRQFQAMNLALKRSPRPVVVAPFGLTLGGGCEMMLHAARVVAHAELYAGMVEIGAGLIPAGGGTTQMALRMDPKTALETIAMAKVSTSAAEARELRLLRRGDEVIANRAFVLQAAKDAARQLADAGYEVPPEASVRAPGPSVEATLKLGVFMMREAEQITKHEQKIGNHLVGVLCAHGAPEGMMVPEAKLREWEREAFLSLCGETNTQERIAYLLRNGKPLRN